MRETSDSGSCWKEPGAHTLLMSEEGERFLSLIHISEPTRRTPISYAVFCLKKKTKRKKKKEEASPHGKDRAMRGEEAKPLKHKNDAERKSDL